MVTHQYDLTFIFQFSFSINHIFCISIIYIYIHPDMFENKDNMSIIAALFRVTDLEIRFYFLSGQFQQIYITNKIKLSED